MASPSSSGFVRSGDSSLSLLFSETRMKHKKARATREKRSRVQLASTSRTASGMFGVAATYRQVARTVILNQ